MKRIQLFLTDKEINSQSSWWLPPVTLSLWEAKVGSLLVAQEFETSLGNMVKPCLYTKYKN